MDRIQMTSLHSRSPLQIRNDLSRVMAEALRNTFSLEDPLVEVTESRNLDFGDLASSSAMPMAAVVKRPPREIAEVMARSVREMFPQVEKVTVDGPGFLNFTLSGDYLRGVASRLATDGVTGLMPRSGAGKRVLVEFVSSNPTGPLTVGHCRQAVLGDAVSGLLEATGWTVEREYYFNDAGKQMERLAESLAARYSRFLGGNMEIPEGGYMGDYIISWAEELLEDRGKDLQWPDNKELFREYASSRAFRLIEEDLSLLGINFNRYFAESELIPRGVDEAVDLLRNLGLVYEDPDCPGKLWLKLTSLGRPEDRVIVRDDGTYTYRMPDIAYHLNKFSRGYHLMVDIFGSDHIDTCRDVEAALAGILGREGVESKLRTILHQFVTLSRGGERIKMSTRSGSFVTLRDLVKEVGSADVVRYIFLTRRAEAHMDFDLAAAASDSDDNPVFYVQYAFARISGILRKLPGGESSLTGPGDCSQLVLERERNLMRLLETVPLRVHFAAEALEPHRITDLLGEIATAFHGFYQHHRVVDPGNEPVTVSRLTLCLAVRNTLRDLLRIIGVRAPEKM